MGTQGSFGYKIGRKIRLMHVQYDADMLWQTCVREIFVLMKHFGSVDLLREAFDKLQEAKNKPKPEAIEKCKPYTDLTVSYQNTEDWYCLTRNCQHSYINILDSGYFLNNGEKTGLIFLLDFNTNSVRFYGINYDKSEEEHENATIDEIMDFDDMPTKTYTEIVTETRDRAEKYFDKMKKVDNEIKELKDLTQKVKSACATQDMIQQATELLRVMENERRKLEWDYRYFYHRLDALNLINHDTSDNNA
jgi:hypothetical protein